MIQLRGACVDFRRGRDVPADLTMKNLRVTLLIAVMLPAAALSQGPKGADRCVTVAGPANGNGTSTQTVCDHSEYKEAVSNAASAITQTGLTYFLVTRPDRQTANNERAYSRDGQFTPVYELLDSLATIGLRSPQRELTGTPTIKSYHLGETWQAFVQDSPNLQKRAVQCAAEKQAKANRHPKKIEYDPCSDVKLMNETPSAHITLDCMERSLGADKNMICQDFDGEVTFDAGRLAELKLILFKDWDDVLPDIIAKFGPPDGQDAGKTLGIWSVDTSHVVATEIEQGSAISWMTPERYKEVVRANKAKPDTDKQKTGNSLDRQ